MTDAIANIPPANRAQTQPSGRSWEAQAAKMRTITLYLMPALFVMTLITFYPLFYQVWMSTTDFGVQNLRAGSAPPTPVGLKNYIDIFTGGLSAKVPSFNF